MARGGQAYLGLEKFTKYFNVAVVLAMMLVVVYGVIMRYVFNAPVHQVAELTEYMMVALTFLALAYIQHERRHVTVSFFVVRQSEKTQIRLRIADTLCALVAFILVTWGSWDYAM